MSNLVTPKKLAVDMELDGIINGFQNEVSELLQKYRYDKADFMITISQHDVVLLDTTLYSETAPISKSTAIVYPALNILH